MSSIADCCRVFGAVRLCQGVVLLALGGLGRADLFVYNFADVGPFGTALSTDGWVGDDIGNFILGSFDGSLYARNSNDGDNTITRDNDGSFSYTIPAQTTFLSLEIQARSNTNFWQFQLSQGSNEILGVGADFNQDNRYFILRNGTRFFESGTTASAPDRVVTVRLDYDVLSGLADLTYSDIAGTQLIMDDVSLAPLDIGTLGSADGLMLRTGSRFVGPSRVTLQTTVVPEPSAFALLLPGLWALRRLFR